MSITENYAIYGTYSLMDNILVSYHFLKEDSLESKRSWNIVFIIYNSAGKKLSEKTIQTGYCIDSENCYTISDVFLSKYKIKIYYYGPYRSSSFQPVNCIETTFDIKKGMKIRQKKSKKYKVIRYAKME